MDERHRYIESLNFAKPDKITFSPGGPRESTLARWHQEGLPFEENYFSYLCRTIGVKMTTSKKKVDIGATFKMLPQYDEEVLEHKNKHYIVRDWSGAVVEISDKYDFTYLRSAKDFVTRRWIKMPVETIEDWDKIKKRYDINTLGRFADDFKERCAALRQRDYPLSVSFSGPFWQLREWCGFENLCIMTIEQPDFVLEMANFWGKFVSDMLDIILKEVCPDHIFISEDMAYKAHSMISPQMVYKYLMPIYNMWIPKLKKKGCPIIEMDSDGFVAELIPIWIEAGFDSCSPMEVAAGNDIVEYRRIYGKKIAFVGGIDKRAIAKGGKFMEDEVMRVVVPLLKDGGFIPGCDHGVPPDISWLNFVNYSTLLAKLTGWL